jgi:hypothetical protein
MIHVPVLVLFLYCLGLNASQAHPVSLQDLFSSPDPKGHVSYCHHLASVRKHFNLLLENHWSKWDQTWQECSFAWFNPSVTFVTIGYPTWLPGAIKASDWLKFLMIFFSDTTWRMELKIVMNDHYKLLTKSCYFLDRLKIQDGHQRGT